jgi:lipoic acid synthetase
VRPDEFVDFREIAEDMGFSGVLAGPLVRSSYRAGRLWARATVAQGRTVPPELSHLLDASPGRQAV